MDKFFAPKTVKFNSNFHKKREVDDCWPLNFRLNKKKFQKMFQNSISRKHTSILKLSKFAKLAECPIIFFLNHSTLVYSIRVCNYTIFDAKGPRAALGLLLSFGVSQNCYTFFLKIFLKYA